ncbi:hypothetical protein TorRG33x02_041820, partial [Trema orientale]
MAILECGLIVCPVYYSFGSFCNRGMKYPEGASGILSVPRKSLPQLGQSLSTAEA